MKNNKKGMTINGLVAAVTIVLALLTTVTISGIDTANNAKKIAFGTEINMIQTAVDAYYTKNNATFPVNQTVKLNVTEPTAFTQSQFTNNGDDISTNDIILYEIDYNLIGIESLKYGRKQLGTNDVYVLSKNSGKVYYAKGLKIGSNTYYTLTDDISNLLSYNSNRNTVDSSIVLFEPSETKWTLNDVTIKVKIPVTCETINSVKIINEDKTETLLTSSTEENGYYIYMATPVGNYSVEVKYKLKASDTEVKTAKYSVRNVDKVSPNIEIDKGNKVKIKTEDITGYISVNSMSDNLSGIKTVKYDYGDFINLYNNEDLKTHFEVTGVELKDDIIFIKSGYDKITVYIEDNAGNFYAEVIDAKLAAEISYPPIPIGFEYLTGTVNTGFVIKNSTDGNEFVWVPVEKGTFVREEGYYNGELQNYMSLTVEPHVTSDGDSEYNAMVESVSKYRGFYIARYEASNNGSDVAQFKADKAPWVKHTLSFAKLYSKSLYADSEEKTQGYAVSTLVYGVQWDATVRWLEKKYPGISKNSVGYGNYSTSVINTGSNTNYALNNIYDMTGNVYEWTMEKYYTDVNKGYVSAIVRGGSINYSTQPISYRYDVYSTYEYKDVGFRVALYVK